MKPRWRTAALDLCIITFGSFCYALAVNLFLAPNNIVMGGITGVAMLIHYYLPWAGIGVLALIMNLPLYFLSWKFIGKRYIGSSVLGTVMSSVLIDLADGLPPVDTEPLMAALAGGLLMGVGLGLVFLRGASTGGTDMIARLMKLKLPHMQMGVLLLGIDVVIVVASMLVFGDINVGLYAILAIFISSRAIDMLLYGMNVERVAYIISQQYAAIAEQIGLQLDRGATYLDGEGTYTGTQRRVIFCAIKRSQIPQLKTIVKTIDPDAFFILTEAHEVLGEGFHNWSDHQ